MVRVVTALRDVRPFVQDRLGTLAAAAAQAEGAAELRLGKRALLLTTPDDVEHVLLRNHRAYAKTSRLTGRGGRRLFGDVLLTSTGEAHLQRRRAVSPAFNRRSSLRFAEDAVSAAQDVAARWVDGEVADVERDTAWLARRVIRRALLGASSSAETKAFDRAVEVRTRYIERVFELPFAVPWPLPSRAHRRGVGLLRRTLAAEALLRADRPADDLLGLLVDALGVEGASDEALVLLVTGHETLAVALAWTCFELARSDDLQSRARVEADALGRRDATADDLPRLGFVERVFDEALRLYPPTWLFVRIALEPDRLPSGAQVRAGAKLYLSPFVLHRDPRLFPEPERFDPDRERRDPAYFPFGGGPRLCVGKALARASGVLAVTTLLQRARFESTGAEPRPSPGITLSQRPPLRLVVVRR
jgi:cytochrome P450